MSNFGQSLFWYHSRYWEEDYVGQHGAGDESVTAPVDDEEQQDQPSLAKS